MFASELQSNTASWCLYMHNLESVILPQQEKAHSWGHAYTWGPITHPITCNRIWIYISVTL